MTRRGPVEVILLSIVTCGIYYLYWIYAMSDEVNRSIGDNTDLSPATELLLSIVTCGLYTIYWYYKFGKKLVQLAGMRGTYVTDNSLVCVLLSIFGFGIISAAILQSQYNQLMGAGN